MKFNIPRISELQNLRVKYSQPEEVTYYSVGIYKRWRKIIFMNKLYLYFKLNIDFLKENEHTHKKKNIKIN